MNAKLRSDFNESDARKREQLKLDWLREQINMRVIGFSWTEFKTPWCSSSDEEVGTVDQLRAHLIEISLYVVQPERLTLRGFSIDHATGTDRQSEGWMNVPSS